MIHNTVPLPSALCELDGLKAVYCSDIHYGLFLDLQRLHELVEQINSLKPDLIILGGDYGEDGPTSLTALTHLKALTAPLGVYGCAGNHDRADISEEELYRALSDNGIKPLINSSTVLHIRDKKLGLCAVDDVICGTPDYAAAFSSCLEADGIIFLPHSPDALPDAFRYSEKPPFFLALCGHTHGGQINPFGLHIRTGSHLSRSFGLRHLAGQFNENGTECIISRGVGYTGLPLRLHAKPELHLITFQQSEANR
ncbi:MAG: metallophosphoesterase [Clostridia bacterium]|nr:metallophosphoesterase [Clostridia bacterium]